MAQARLRMGRGYSTLILFLLLVLSFVLRLAPLGRYVTPDEPAWVYRSIRFLDALTARDWSTIPSTGHPGVTTMWLGAAGVSIRRLLDPAGSATHLNWVRKLAWLASENGEAFPHLAFFLSLGRVAVALTTSIALLAVYGLTRRLFDEGVGLLATGLLAFDSFLTAHSGLLHTDALLSTFCLLALLSALNGMRAARPARWWALSGAFTGLALLTKTPALILPPFVLLLIALRLALPTPSASLRGSRLLRSGAHYLLFLLSTVAVVFALYPALWADALEVMRTSIGFAGHHVEMAQRPILFAGRETYHPGPAFYPVVFLLRASPLLLLGLLVGLVRIRHLMRERRLILFTLLAFAVLLGIAINLGAKKHDRYLLPAFPPLTVAAALGWEHAIRRWADRRAQGAFPIPKLLVSSIITLQFLISLVFWPHPLTYLSPLAGGPAVAARILPVGWGEGMGATARWLNQLPDAEALTVATNSVPSLAPLFVGHTVPLDQAPLADYLVRGSSEPTTEAAYVVSLGRLDYATVLTNTAPSQQADWLASRAQADDLILLDADTPLPRRYEGPGTILSAASLPDEAALADWLAPQLSDRTTAWLVSSPAASPITAAQLQRQLRATAIPATTATVGSASITRFALDLPPSLPQPSPLRATFGGQLELVDASVPQTVAWPNPLRVTLRWRARTEPHSDLRALVTLRNEEGQIWTTAEGLVINSFFFPTSTWAVGEWVDLTYDLSLPAGIPPATYTVEVSLYDDVTGAGKGATGPNGAFRGTRLPVELVTLLPPESATDIEALDIARHFDLEAGPLTLLGADPPEEQVLSGGYLSSRLFWQAETALDDDYRMRLRLVDYKEEIGLEQVVPLSPYPTSQWRAEDRFQSRQRIHVPPSLTPGFYNLTINVLDGEGEAIWADDQDLGRVEVLPRERSFDLPADIAHPTGLNFGSQIHLRGYTLTERELSAGDSVQLTLYWQAEGPTERDYTLFVHVLDASGTIQAQEDHPPGGDSAPTSSWAAGQVIVSDIAIPIPGGAPSGTYHIAVGLYDPAYGNRLPVTDSEGRSLPDNQAILSTEITIAGGTQ